MQKKGLMDKTPLRLCVSYYEWSGLPDLFHKEVFILIGDKSLQLHCSAWFCCVYGGPGIYFNWKVFA
jgi:hypothetical protein